MSHRADVQPCTATESLASSALLPRPVSALRSSALPFIIQKKLDNPFAQKKVQYCAAMAEALAAVAVVASIVQLVDFSTRVVSRLDEFYAVTREVPKSFRHVKTELPLLAATLAQLKEAIDTTSVAQGLTTALVPVIAGCNEQVEQLDDILRNMLPEASDSWRIKGKKVIVSLGHDSKVESIMKTLENYIRILTFYYAAASSTLQPLTGRVLLK
jgi:prefoldin subunit 5